MQTRFQSAVEVGANYAAGFAVAWLANYYVLPFFVGHVTPRSATGITVFFTVLSVARSYVFRRLFNWIHRR